MCVCLHKDVTSILARRAVAVGQARREGRGSHTHSQVRTLRQFTIKDAFARQCKHVGVPCSKSLIDTDLDMAF